MIYLFENTSKLENEIKYAKLKGGVAFYINGSFVDENGNNIDISNNRVSLFVSPSKLEEVIEKLEAYGCLLENSLKEIHNIQSWYAFYEPKRLVLPYVGEDTISKIDEIFHYDLFFKTETKDFSSVIEKSELLDLESPIRKAIRKYKNKNYLLSDYIEIDKDEYGYHEYRVFVRDSRILNVSRFLGLTYHRVPKELIKFTQDIIDEIDPSFATSYVIDLAYYNLKWAKSQFRT